MSGYKLPKIDEVSLLSDNEVDELIDNLFEHHITLHRLLKPVIKEQVKSYVDLIEKTRKFFRELLILNSDSQDILDIIVAHPRLGPSKNKTTNELSEHSSEEQKSLTEGSIEEAAQLSQLNELYEQKFPGLRYVVFVNGRTRGAIMENMRSRIAQNSIETEKMLALDAMCDIAIDRAKKLLTNEKECSQHKL